MEQNKLLGKRILYIGLDYFGYPTEIIKELERAGATVRFFPIYPPGNKIKLIRRFSDKLKNKVITNYYSTLLNDDNDFDYLFFITIHWIPLNLMHRLMNKFQNSKFILYNWDSLETHDYLPYIKYFNKVFSFDMKDLS